MLRTDRVLIIDSPTAVETSDVIVITVPITNRQHTAKRRSFSETTAVAPDKRRVCLFNRRRVGAELAWKQQVCNGVLRRDESESVIAALAA